MKTKLLYLVAIPCVLGLLGTSQGLLAEEKTIEGTITATSYDDQGNITAVSIVTAGEDVAGNEGMASTEEYKVADDANGKELKDHIGEKVEVTGNVQEDETSGAKTIQVTEYKLISEEEQPQEDRSPRIPERTPPPEGESQE